MRYLITVPTELIIDAEAVIDVPHDVYRWEYVITDPVDLEYFKYQCDVLHLTHINFYPPHDTLLLHQDFEFLDDRVYGLYVIKKGDNFYRKVLEDFLNEL